MVLRVRWCDIFILNVHKPTEDKKHYPKDRFYEKLKQMCHFPKYHSIILLGYFNSSFGKRIFSKRQMGIKVPMSIVMIMVLQQ
jgi:hypothetical protein